MAACRRSACAGRASSATGRNNNDTGSREGLGRAARRQLDNYSSCAQGDSLRERVHRDRRTKNALLGTRIARARLSRVRRGYPSPFGLPYSSWLCSYAPESSLAGRGQPVAGARGRVPARPRSSVHILGRREIWPTVGEPPTAESTNNGSARCAAELSQSTKRRPPQLYSERRTPGSSPVCASLWCSARSALAEKLASAAVAHLASLPPSSPHAPQSQRPRK